MLGPEESHREQNELCGHDLFRAGHFDRDELAFLVLLPSDLHGDELFDRAVLIAVEALYGRDVRARIGTELSRGFFLAVIHLVDLRPLRPRIVRGAIHRRLLHDLDLREALAAVTHRGRDAIGAGIAAADHDDVLAARVNRRRIGAAVEQRLRARGQVVHREMDAFQVAAVDRQIARLRRTRTDHDRIEVLSQELRFDVLADVRVADELDALLLHELEAPFDHFALVELHVRDAVHEQSARAVCALEHRHGVTRAIELRRRGEAGRTRSDHRYLLAGAHLRRFGHDPALFPGAIDDRRLDRLDGHRRVRDAEHARAFARSRAHASREIREVVRHVQAFDRLVPEPAVDEIVPLGNHVVDRAARSHAADELARVTEGHAAVHAARGLLTHPFLFHVMMEFLPVAHALLRCAVDRQLAQVFDESGGLTHVLSLSFVNLCRRPSASSLALPRVAEEGNLGAVACSLSSVARGNALSCRRLARGRARSPRTRP